MPSNDSMKTFTMVATSVPPELGAKVNARAKAELSTMSDHIRNVVAKWIEAGSPVLEVPMERFRVHLGAYFTQVDYNRLKDVSLRRRLSLAHAIRIAMAWYHK